MMRARVARKKRQPKNVAVGIVPIVNNIHAAARPDMGDREMDWGAGNDDGKGIPWRKEGRERGGSVVLGVFPSHPQVSLQPDYVSWECIAGKQTYLRERVAFQQLVSLL